MKMADIDCRLESVGFPALGTGNLNYPPQMVAKCMMEAIVEYIEQSSRTELRKVHIVLYPDNRRVCQVSYGLIEVGQPCHPID